jgi:hypothetical protein
MPDPSTTGCLARQGDVDYGRWRAPIRGPGRRRREDSMAKDKKKDKDKKKKDKKKSKKK